MTGEARRRLRALVDERSRARARRGRCAGCGAAYELETPGCLKCADRAYRRHLRRYHEQVTR